MKVLLKRNNWRKNKRKTRRRKTKKKKNKLRIIITKKTMVIPIKWMGTTNQMVAMMGTVAAVMRIIRIREVKNAHKSQNKMMVLIMKL